MKIEDVQHGEEFDQIADLLFFCEGCKTHHGITTRKVDLKRLTDEDRKSYVKNKKPRWTFNGDYDKPTFKPSIHIKANPRKGKKITICHSFITNGSIRYLGDCRHDLKNKTVELPDLETL